MPTGSCRCGTVRFEADEVAFLTHCHCTYCRKITGAAYATYAHVDKKKFRFLAGEDRVTHAAPEHGGRKFCSLCGSPTPGQADYLPSVSIYAGTFDDDPGIRPSLHTFTSSKASWHEITDGLPQFETWVPGYEPKK